MEKIWLNNYDSFVPNHIKYQDLTIYKLFKDSVLKSPHERAVIFSGNSICYLDLLMLVDRFANALLNLGVKKGDRVGIILPNIPAYPITHLAAMKLGAIVVPVNSVSVERELSYQLVNAGVETVVVYDELFNKIENIRNNTPLKNIIIAGNCEFAPRIKRLISNLRNNQAVQTNKDAGVYSCRELINNTAALKDEIEVKSEDPAALIYTGGTSGVLKGALLTHKNLIANVYQTKLWLGPLQEGREVFLCALPFFHSYGMTSGLHVAIAARSAMLLVKHFKVREVMKQIKKYKPTLFCGVPDMYKALAHSIKASNTVINSLRLCVCGGAVLSSETQRSFEKSTGARLVQGYGLSEASPVTHINPVSGRQKTGTIGLPVSDTDARVVDPINHKELPIGETGELTIKGPQVMKEYWNMPEETKLVLQDGWLYTGDLVVMDDEGFFTLVDRRKKVISSSGTSVYPKEVEEVLYYHPAVKDAAVVGVPGRFKKQRIKAYIVLKEDVKVTKRKIIKFCKKNLSNYKVPSVIEFVDNLPGNL